MAATLDEETASKVVDQVEYYFSDRNFSRDKFLQHRLRESVDGRVSLALICSFYRMKEYLGMKKSAGPHDVPEETVAAVAEVLRKSAPTVQLSDDGKRVGRVNKLLKPEKVLEQVHSRTVS